MENQLDIYVTLRSPYSYLASRRLAELVSGLDIPVHFRPVYPIAIKDPAFFERSDPLWISYLIRDTVRVAELNDMPYHWPDPDPIVQDLETRAIAEDQPHIRRLTRLTVAAEEEGKGFAFYAEISAMIFGGTRGWNEGDHMAQAAERAGLVLNHLEAKTEADPESYDTRIAENDAAQRKAGHWGTPLLVFNGEPFFGQDRIDMCIWRMAQQGIGPEA